MAKSKRDRIKEASKRWTAPGSFDALLGRKSNRTTAVKEPSILQISPKKQSTIPKPHIPKPTIPISRIPKQHTPKPDIPKSDTPRPAAKASASGYFSIPFALVDDLLPTLQPSEASIFLRIYRLTRGFNRLSALTGYVTLCRNTALSKNTAKASVLALLAKGLIARKSISANNFEYTVLYHSSGPAFNVPNSLFDTVFPSIKPLEQTLFLYLWRHSVGESRQVTGFIGYTVLCKAANSSKNPVVQSLRGLENRKYILFTSRAQQGSIYRIQTDTIPNSDIPKSGIPKNGVSKNLNLVYQNKGHSVSDFDAPLVTKDSTKTTTTDVAPNSDIPKLDIPKPNTPEHEMLLLLCSNGIQEKIAVQLVGQHGPDSCRKGLQYALDFQKRKQVSNLPGLIAEAIASGYTTSSEQQERRNQELRAAADETLKNRIDAVRRKLHEGLYISTREYDLLPQQEKEELTFDEDFYRQKKEWRYKKAV
jgi:hypothetical protein